MSFLLDEIPPQSLMDREYRDRDKSKHDATPGKNHPSANFYRNHWFTMGNLVTGRNQPLEHSLPVVEGFLTPSSGNTTVYDGRLTVYIRAMRTLHLVLHLVLICFSLVIHSGCGVLIGSVKPVSERSGEFRVMDLTRQAPDWERIDSPAPSSSETSEESEASAIPDVAYQSRKTASIISLNSACRPRIEASEQTLKEFTDQLFLGVARITSRQEKETTVAGTSALDTTVTGRLNGEDVKIRTVVLREGRCLYDLSYIARPDRYHQDEDLFSQFVASLRLK